MGQIKLLSDTGWKDVASKAKIKDNGLLKLLSEHKRLGEDEHAEVLGSLDQILKLAVQLKKSKDVAGAPAVLKYVGELSDAAESERRVVEKAKGEADKKSKAQAEAKKEEERKGSKDAGEDEEEEEASVLLGAKMVPLLRMINKGETMHTLVATTGKQTVVLLSKKPIAPSRRKLLADELGGAGGIKYIPGHCVREAGMTTFALKTQAAGMAKKLKLALLAQTGLRVKLRCRGEDGETDEDLEEPDEPKGDQAEGGGMNGKGDRGKTVVPADQKSAEPATAMTRPFELAGSVGQGGKNDIEDVKQVQIALNRRADAGLTVDGRCGPATIKAIIEFQRAIGQAKPDGRVDAGRGTARALSASGKVGKAPPPPSPMAPPANLGEKSLARAPLVWHGTREILDHNISELKRAIKQEYSNEHPALLAEIDQNVNRVDVILEKLDGRLAESLERAGAAKTAPQRATELASAKKILTEYVAFVKTEPLIEHIDKNPFGVDAQVRKVITDSLSHIIKSIA